MTTDMAISKTNWWKIGVMAAIIIAIFYAGCQYGVHSVIKTIHTDTTIRHDTLKLTGKPVPYKVTHDSLIYVKGRPVLYAVHDTLEPLVNPADTQAILKRFFETAYYKDVRDIKRGTVTIEDTVTQNRIAGRSVKVVVADTTIEKTITLTQPKRIILYWGGNIIGNPNNIIYGAGTDVSLKWQNDMIYGLGVKWLNGHQMFYEGKVMFPIRLKKSK